jgi:hypothetical protein
MYVPQLVIFDPLRERLETLNRMNSEIGGPVDFPTIKNLCTI